MGLELSLKDRFEGLNLHGEEQMNLNFCAKLKTLINEVRRMAIFRVHTTRMFSHTAIFNMMCTAWASTQQITFKTMGANLFIFQLRCRRD